MRPAKAVKLGEEFLKGISEGELVSMQVMEKDYKVKTVIPDVPDLAPNANRSMRARPDDPCVLPKRSPETRYDEQWQNI